MTRGGNDPPCETRARPNFQAQLAKVLHVFVVWKRVIDSQLPVARVCCCRQPTTHTLSQRVGNYCALQPEPQPQRQRQRALRLLWLVHLSFVTALCSRCSLPQA